MILDLVLFRDPSVKRHVAKTITWRIVGTIDTMIIGWLITGDAMICWMGEKPMQLNGKYSIQHTTRSGRAIIKEIVYIVDLNELKRLEGKNSLEKNGIARIKIKTTTPLFFDSYRTNRNTGSFILIDETNFNTVGAGMIN